MSDDVIFRRFHHITIAVRDLEKAVDDWELVVGWPPDRSAPPSVRFLLNDAYVELIQADPGQVAPKVISVSVVVDDPDAAADKAEQAGVVVRRNVDGLEPVNECLLSGVRIELCREDGPPVAPEGALFRRISHLVVAVADDEAAKELWAGAFGSWAPEISNGRELAHHIPVGRSWFGLTAAGTNADAVGRFVESRGEGIYAVGLVVDDLETTKAALAARGARMIDTGSGQVFLHPSTTHGLLVDLVAAKGH